jgi:hypothetical protein
VVGVTGSLAFCVVFCRSLFVLLSFFFWSLYITCPSIHVYGFWLSLWHLQTFLLIN